MRGLLLCGAVAAGYAAFAYPRTLNMPRFPVHPEGSRAAVVANGPARRAVWILVDGLRLDASRRMRALNRLRREGADIEGRAVFPSYTIPNFVAQASGIGPRASGIRVNGYDREVELDSVFRLAKRAGLRTAVVSSEGYFTGLYRSWIDESRVADDSSALPDGALVLVHLLYVDDAGHAHGGASRQYAAAVRRSDAVIEAIARRLNPAQDTLIVTSDHGHTDRGGHGGTEPEVVNIPIVLWGAGVPAGAGGSGASARDVGPTIAALLGLGPLGEATGRSWVDGESGKVRPRVTVQHAVMIQGPYPLARCAGPLAVFVCSSLLLLASHGCAERRAWLASPTYLAVFAMLYCCTDTFSFSTANDDLVFAAHLTGISALAGLAQRLLGGDDSLVPATAVTSFAVLAAVLVAPGPLTAHWPSPALCFLPIPAFGALALACFWAAITPNAATLFLHRSGSATPRP